MRKDSDVSRLRQFTIMVALLWVSAICVSLYVISVRESREVVDRASREARTALSKYKAYYSWAAEYGGVYIQLKNGNLKNLSSEDVGIKEIETESGETLAFVDPAHMTKMVQNLEKANGVLQGHIVSINPLNLENTADDWERGALEKLAENKQDVYQDTHEDKDSHYARIMEPLMVKEECLQCHREQGYKAGDIAGGISATVEFVPFSILNVENVKQFLFWHLIMLFGGLGLILGGAATLISRLRERNRIEGDLSRSQNRFSAFMENLPGLAFIRNREGKYLYANQKYIELNRGNEASASLEISSEVFPKKETEKSLKNDSLVWNGDLNITLEEESEHDGRRLSWLINKFPLKDGDNGETMVGGIGVDITNLNMAKEELVAKEQLLSRLSRKLMSSHENERAILSREIHDEIGQKLTGIHLELLAMKKKDSGSNVERVMKIVQEMDTSLRRIYNGLRPVTLDRLGLVPALQSLLSDYSSSVPGLKISFNYEMDEGGLPDKDISLTIFRIVQELMTNVIKHADAENVDINIEKDAKTLTLFFRDDGRGFTGVSDQNRERFGLVGISERALQHGGKVTIDTGPGKGTAVTVFFQSRAGSEK